MFIPLVLHQQSSVTSLNKGNVPKCNFIVVSANFLFCPLPCQEAQFWVSPQAVGTFQGFWIVGDILCVIPGTMLCFLCVILFGP